MEKNFRANDKILIQMKKNHKQFESEFYRYTPDGIEVRNSKDLNSGKFYHHVQTFYNSEIEKLLPLNGSTQSSESNVEPSSSSQCDRRRPIVIQSHTLRKFSDSDVERLKNNIKKMVYISQFDDKYYNAISDMQAQKIITVHPENRFGRLEQRPLIAVATPNQVYLFDVKLLGMKKELKEIFASGTPRKIVHSAAHLADYLHHNESCSLNKVFDTLMVHFTLKQTRKPIPLIECFQIYFELPTDFVLEQFDYQSRPLKKEALVRCAINVLLLEELYWYFNDILLKPLHIATQQFSMICVDVENQVDLMNNLNYGRFPGIENIDINAANDIAEAFENLNTK